MARTKKVEKTEKIDNVLSEPVAKKLSPFDIMGFMFSNNWAEFSKLSNKELEKNHFIINDRFSIFYPQHAQFFNHYKINGASVVKCWYQFIARQNFGRAPQWVYTKGKKKTQEEKKDKNELTDAEIKEFALANNVSIVDIKFLLEIDYNHTKIEIDNYFKEKAELEKLRKATLKDMKKQDSDEEEEIILDTNDPNQMSMF